MIITWSQAAERDVLGHFDYLAARNPDAALKMEAAIREAVQRLADFPYLGRPGRREGTRELVIAHQPYLVVYSVTAVEIFIIRVWHGAQNWQEAPDGDEQP